MASGYRFQNQGNEADQEVKACGRNDTGQLGVGDDLEHSSLHTVRFSALHRHRVLLLATGTHHTLALTTHEQTPLFGWGWGKYGQLGTAATVSSYSPVAIPVQKLLDDSSVVDISAGYSHSAFVTSSGRLFTTGRNDLGQLGLGHLSDRLEFTHVKSLSNIAKVSVGEYFCVALERSPSGDDVDRLWSFGSNEFGQLGIGDSNDRSRPHLVKLSDLGTTYTPVSGLMSENPTGGGRKSSNTAITRVHLLRTGPFHCVVSLSNHRIYSWGRGDCGQTGLGQRKNVNLPQPMTRLMELVGEQPLRLLAVRAHNIAVTSHTGEIAVWGRNNHAQLGLTLLDSAAPGGTAHTDSLAHFGNSDFEDHSDPRLNTSLGDLGVCGAEITDIAVGPFHSSVIMDNGQLLMWGAVSEAGMPRTHRLESDDGNTASHIPKPTVALHGSTVSHVGAGYSHVVFVLDPPVSVNRSTLDADFGASLDDPTFSDISIIVQDRVIHAHRVVLASRSKFFRAMFSSGMVETKQREVTIRDCSYDAFYALLLFLYTDSFHNSRSEVALAQLALDVLPLAELYDLPRLLQLCESTLIETPGLINADTVLDLYELACRLRATNLRNRCNWFISKHFDQIVETEAWIHKVSVELKSHFHSLAILHSPPALEPHPSSSAPSSPPVASATASGNSASTTHRASTAPESASPTNSARSTNSPATARKPPS